MDWSDEKIMSNFHGVIRDSRILKKREVEEKYSEFKKEFEKLYGIAVECAIKNDSQGSIKKLKHMLEIRNKIKNKSMTSLHGDMEIGNYLGKEYIYPVTKTPSKEDYIRAVKEITSKVNNV